MAPPPLPAPPRRRRRLPVLLLAAALAAASLPGQAQATSPEDMHYLGTFKFGLPPSWVGVWVEERELGADQPGAVSRLTRTWLPGGSPGFGSWAEANASADGELLQGGFMLDRFEGWQCAREAGVVRVLANSTCMDEEGGWLQTRELCLEGAVSDDGLTLTYNYTLLEDGCPEGHERYTARRVAPALPGAGGEEAGRGSLEDCPP